MFILARFRLLEDLVVEGVDAVWAGRYGEVRFEFGGYGDAAGGASCSFVGRSNKLDCGFLCLGK